MDKYIWSIITKFQEIRTKRLSKIAGYFIAGGITANHLTVLSLVSGILAIHFFLGNWWLLALFSLLHLLLDALDGVLARLTKETTWGKYFDLTADSFPVILLLIKIGWFFQEIFSYLVAGLFTISLLFFFLSKLKTAFIPLRTPALIAALISTLPFFSSPPLPVITFCYLAGGVCSVYALARQLQWFITHKRS